MRKCETVEEQTLISEKIIILKLKQEYINLLIELEHMTIIHDYTTDYFQEFLKKHLLPWESKFYGDFSSDQNRYLYLKDELSTLNQIKHLYVESLSHSQQKSICEIAEAVDNFHCATVLGNS